MIGKMKLAAVAVFATALGFAAAPSQAATIVQSGSTYGGWAITLPAGISLVVDSVSADQLTLEKFAAFPNMEGLPITFTQTSPDAVSVIDFANEEVTNLSGSDWSGFQFLLANVSQSLGAGAASFPGTTFAAPDGFSSPTVGSDTITYNGSQANGSTSSWGFGTDGDLLIDANPSTDGQFVQDFVFKEQPLTSNSVPVANAAWQGLAGLLGLGFIAIAKKAKKVMA